MKILLSVNQSLATGINRRRAHTMPAQKFDLPFSKANACEVRYCSFDNVPVFDDDGNVAVVIYPVTGVSEIVQQEMTRIKKGRDLSAGYRIFGKTG